MTEERLEAAIASLQARLDASRDAVASGKRTLDDPKGAAIVAQCHAMIEKCMSLGRLELAQRAMATLDDLYDKEDTLRSANLRVANSRLDAEELIRQHRPE